MQFSKSALLALLPALACAAPLEQRDDSVPFSLLGVFMYEDQFIEVRNITASNASLNLNGETATFCPGQSIPNCGSFPNTTVLSAVPGTGVPANMYDNVPGGQRLYIAPDGALKYNVAHSSVIPQGSQSSSFNFVAPSANGLGKFNNGTTFNSYLACPTFEGANPVTDVFPIYANISTLNAPLGGSKGCIFIQVDAVKYDGGLAAWQYS